MPRKKGSKNKKPTVIDLKKKKIKIDFLGEPISKIIIHPLPVYKVTLKSVGRTYQAEGATFEEAIAGIKVMGGVKAMAVLIVEKGDQRKERIINGQIAQKLFGAVGPTMREIAFKQINQMIGL